MHIANLLKKGYIKDKGNIVMEEKMVSVLGGANIDLQGFPNDKLVFKDSNPGKIETTLGGVGRNIAENLARLAVPVRLFSAVGNDFYGQKLINESLSLGIDMKNVLISDEYPTSLYLAIMDEEHDLKVAVSQMEIFKKIDARFIQDNQKLIKDSSLIVIDANIPKGTIDYVCSLFQEIPIFIDPVSTIKAMRLKDSLGKFHTIKPNIYEVAKLLEIEINSMDKVRKAGEMLLNLGIKRAFISMGKEGIYACDQEAQLVVKAKTNKIKSATGAGDAFMAGIVDSYLKNRTLVETAIYATGASIIALNSYSTINPLMSEGEILKVLTESYLDLKILK